MSVWVVCPSARPIDHVAKWAASWRERGYAVAIYRNDGVSMGVSDGPIIFTGPAYPGYAVAVNDMIEALLHWVQDSEWFIPAGDDIFPDPNHTADEIARECRDHFAALECVQHRSCGCLMCIKRTRTFGVMQPTGDRYGEERRSQHPLIPTQAYIDRVAGSAWIGREFAKRVNQGNGPLWPEYFHMGVDEELQAVATKLGVFWQRPDLTHHHEHWARKTGRSSDMPTFLARANSAEEWAKYKHLFAARQAAGFPGSEPL